jgi:hypothetical protein
MAFTDDSTKLLVAVKAYARGNALPLDNSEVYANKAEAEVYAASATAYAGQTIKVLEEGKYITYVLDPKEDGGFSLTKVGVDASVVTDVNDLKQSVAVNTATLAGQAETVAQHTTDIAANKKAIEDEVADRAAAEAEFTADIAEIKGDYLKQADKTALSNAISAAEAAAKEHADNAVAALVDGAPETLNTLDELAAALKDNADIVQVLENAIATKASAQDLTDLSNTVSGNKTELDEAIKALQDRAADLESADGQFATDFAKLQEAVTKNTEDIAKEAERASGEEAELLAEINKVSGNLGTEVARLEGLIGNKANATDIVELQNQITANTNTLNSKVDTATFQKEISDLEQVITGQETELKGYVDGRIGAIDASTTLKQYIDSAVGSGGTASAEAIATAKAEAIAAANAYTNEQLSWVSYNPA